MTEKEVEDCHKRMHQDELHSSYSDGWYCIGELEFTNDIPNYYYSSSKYDDYIWLKQDPVDTVINDKGEKVKRYRYCIGGSPLNGNNFIANRPWGIIEILKSLVHFDKVCFGVTQNGYAIQSIPKGVRLKGMTEYIMREEI